MGVIHPIALINTTIHAEIVAVDPSSLNPDIEVIRF